jgi:hypothetical protein
VNQVGLEFLVKKDLTLALGLHDKFPARFQVRLPVDCASPLCIF